MRNKRGGREVKYAGNLTASPLAFPLSPAAFAPPASSASSITTRQRPSLNPLLAQYQPPESERKQEGKRCVSGRFTTQTTTTSASAPAMVASPSLSSEDGITDRSATLLLRVVVCCLVRSGLD